MTTALRLATRGSPLARYQAELVRSLLEPSADGRPIELVVVETVGDRVPELPLGAFDSHGMFIAEVEHAVLDGRADVAVHSAKDLPSGSPPAGMQLASVPVRADPRDALCGASLDHLGYGATVASGAMRRRAQLGAVRPDLCFIGLRGNIATRLAAVPDGGAVVVAMAALERLSLAAHADQILDVETMLPQVGQGAIALRCRDDDEVTRSLLFAIDDPSSHRCLLAERAFLATLGGGCDAPVGGYATPIGAPDGSDDIVLEGLLAAEDGSVVIRRRAVGDEPENLGRALAHEILEVEGASSLVEAATRR